MACSGDKREREIQESEEELKSEVASISSWSNLLQRENAPLVGDDDAIA